MNNPDDKGVYYIDDVYMWLEQESSVMLKASTKEGDPVELSAQNVEDMIEVLQKLLAQLS